MHGLVIYKHDNIKCVQAIADKFYEMGCRAWGLNLRANKTYDNTQDKEFIELIISHDEEVETEKIKECLLIFLVENIIFIKYDS